MSSTNLNKQQESRPSVLYPLPVALRLLFSNFFTQHKEIMEDTVHGEPRLERHFSK